tara:strand:- start:112 stop:342 length:231 start_codon:yes stop_codon:yes gene_type:complete
MKYLSSRIFYAIFLYVLLMTLIFLKKPALLFNKDGEIKQFGLNKEKDNTIYSIGVLSVILAIISFYIFCIIDVIFR